MGSFDERRCQTLMAEINVVPLVDVVLVLLVVFIITAPLLTHAVKIDLPKASSSSGIMQPGHVEIDIQQDGRLFWNGAAVTLEVLPARFAAEAAKPSPPELHIHADRLAYYEYVAQVMSLAASTGITRIGFITDPATR